MVIVLCERAYNLRHNANFNWKYQIRIHTDFFNMLMFKKGRVLLKEGQKDSVNFHFQTFE